MPSAVIWDVDGTLSETERDGHRVAFNRAFEDEGLPWSWDADLYGELLTVTGGYERLLHDMARRSDAPASSRAREALARHLHLTKNRHYAAIVEAGGIGLRPGVARVFDACAREGIRLAIATTTSRANVAALLRAALTDAWGERFDAIVCAEDAPVKKPHPQAYQRALAALGLDATAVVAVEDSPNGLDAANAAGIATLVTRSFYFRDASFDRPAAICDDLDSPVRWAGGTAGRVDVDLLRSIVAAGRGSTVVAQGGASSCATARPESSAR